MRREDPSDELPLRLRGRSKNKPSRKGKPSTVAWLGLFIALASLLVTGAGQYYAVLLQQDDLRAIIRVNWGPSAVGPKLATSTGIASITFFNAGNRSAVITFLEYHLVRVDRTRTDPQDCWKASHFNRVYSLEPIILKPGDIAVPFLREGASIENNDPVNPGDEFLMCIAVVASTPDSETQRTVLMKGPFLEMSGYAGSTFLYMPDVPIPPDVVLKDSHIRVFGWRL